MPYGAPQTAATSADVSVLMNAASIWRSRSGDVEDSWSCRKREGRYQYTTLPDATVSNYLGTHLEMNMLQAQILLALSASNLTSLQ